MSHRETFISPIYHTVKLGVGGAEKSPLEYNMGDKNVKDDKGDNKNFFQKYQMPYIFETTSLIRSE